MERRHSEASLVTLLIAVSGLLFLWPSGLLEAQTAYQVPATPPPIEAQFVREGDFAAALADVLGVTDGQNEAEAERELSALGVAPRNGWVSDDPVTPDIIADLQAATANAADAKLLPLFRDEALRRFVRIVEQSGMAISPGAGAEAFASSGAMIYPDPPDITDYYVTEGPPVITYYEPPPAYYYLYSWVPYPFWYGGTAFAGYYILRDRHGHHGHRHASNHGSDGAQYYHRTDRGYGFNGRPQGGHDGSRRPTGSAQWRQEGSRRMVGSASFPRNRMPEARRPVTPAIPTLSGRGDQGGAREAYANPQVARPSMGQAKRLSPPRTFHPSPPALNSADVRQDNPFRGSPRPAVGPAGIRQGGPFGEGFRPPAQGGWSRGSSAHGFEGRGFTGFRR